MLRWDDDVTTSSAELKRMVKLATAGVDRILEELSGTEATLDALIVDGEDRAAVLERVPLQPHRVEHIFSLR